MLLTWTMGRGVLPHVNFVCSLRLCGNAKAILEGMLWHACIVDHERDDTTLLGNLLVQMYGRCQSIEDAISVFMAMHKKNLFTWNAIISACACNGNHKKALEMFHRMCHDGFKPNKFVFSSIITACSSPEALHEGKKIHALIKQSGLDSDIVVGTALLNMYGKCGCMKEATDLFYKLPERDIVSWNAMIAACAQHELSQDALYFYQQMLEEGSLPDGYTLGSVLDACITGTTLFAGKLLHTIVVAGGLETDVVVGTALINMYGKCGSLTSALTAFEIMRQPNRITFINILSTCATHVAIDEGRRVHTQVVFYGFKLDVNLGNSVINMYGKCTSLVDAHSMFSSMPERDVISWNAIIAVYAQNGQMKNALSICSQMCHDNISPDSTTFINILSACSHAGLMEDGFQCFLSMEREHGVTASIDHYNCMIDLLVRAGQLNVAEHVLHNMQFEPTCVSWTTLLGACRTEGDIKRGNRIAQHVLKLDSSNAAHCVTLANIYAAAGRSDEAVSLVCRMIETQLYNGHCDLDMWQDYGVCRLESY